MRTISVLITALILTSFQALAGDLRVKWVYDGDTILLSNGLKVRYIGINAPETAHGDQKEEFFGNEARKRNMDLVKGRKVSLKFDEERRDRYGRTLAYVYLEDGTFVNEALLKEGFAYCLYNKPNTRHSGYFLKIQKKAIEDRKGMWKNLTDKKGIYPANLKSLRFHRQDCENAGKIKKRNRIIFNSRKEAFLHGYSPGRECNP